VGHLEIDLDSGPLGVAFGALDGCRRVIDSGCRISMGSKVNGMIAVARARVEVLTGDTAVRHQLLHRWLRAGDIPRDSPVGESRLVIQRFETGDVRVSHCLSLTRNAIIYPVSAQRCRS